MPRATWSGSISFGLVNIPIKLYTAVSRKNVRFNQIDTRTGSRVKQKRVSEADGTEVPYEAIVKGYELSSGQYVMVTEDELAALDPEASRTIDIEEFVDLAEIDPIFYDATYWIAPDKATVKPYALLLRAMEESGKVGIARFVMRSKQYLCRGAARRRPARAVDDGLRRRDQRPGRDPRAANRSTTSTCSDRELAMAQPARRVARRRVRAGQVPRHLPREGPRPDRAQGGGRDRAGRGAGRGGARRRSST